MNILRPSTWGFETLWTDSGKTVWEKIKSNFQKVFTLPSQEGREAISQGAKEVVSGVTKMITPSLVWIGVILIIGLVLYVWVRKLVKI